MSQSIAPGLYGVLLFIVITGVAVELFIPSSTVAPAVVTIVDGPTVVSPSVVVSAVGIVNDVVALVPLSVVVSAVAIETNSGKLPPPAVVLLAAVIAIDVVGIWDNVEPLDVASAAVSAVVIDIGVVTCTYEKRKIKNNTLKTYYNFLKD